MKRIAILYGSPLEFSYGGIAPFIKNLDAPLQSNFTVEYLEVPNFLFRLRFLPQRIIKFFYYLFIIMRLKKFDFILSHEPEASYIASLSKVPYAHIFHGNNNPMSQSRFSGGHHFSFIFEFFRKEILKTASLKYTVGVESEGIPKILNPISHNIQPVDINKRGGFIFCGRLEKIKNIDKIIEAYSLCDDEVKNEHTLYIAGIGTQLHKLKELAIQLNCNVIFLGQLRNEELIKCLSNKKILLMASSQEGLPMVIAESLSVGVPVITTDVGDISRVIKSNFNGYLIPLSFSMKLYVNSIYKILDSYKCFSSNALSSSEIFDAYAIANRISNDINNLFHK